jgi:hypothetical protein
VGASIQGPFDVAAGGALATELLTGDYANPKGSFGLKAVSPFTFPKA